MNLIQHNVFSVIMLSVVMLSVGMQSVVMLSVVAPINNYGCNRFYGTAFKAQSYETFYCLRMFIIS